MKRSKMLLSASAVLLSLSLAACGPKLDQKPAASPAPSGGGQPAASSSGGGDFAIGLPTSLSGGTAKFGEASKRAAQLAIDEFNEAGGANGKKAKLIVYDDEAKPEKSVEAVTRLIQQDKVVALIGPANSGNAMAHIKIAQEAGIPEIVPVATGTGVTKMFEKEAKNYIFRITPYDRGQVDTMLKWLIEEKKYTKIGLMNDTTGYGQGGKKDVEEVMKEKYNTKPVLEESFQIGDTNMESQLKKMRDANVEAVIFYGLAPEDAQYLKSREKLNYYPVTFGTWSMGDPTVKELVGSNTNLLNKDIYFTQSYTIDQSEASKAFHDKIVKKYGDDIFPIASAQGYDTTRIILDAVKKVGTDPKAIRDAIENTEGFKGVTAVSEKPFNKDKHEGLTVDNMFIATYKDGNIVKLK